MLDWRAIAHHATQRLPRPPPRPPRLLASAAVTVALLAAPPARGASATPTRTASPTAPASESRTGSPSYAPGVITTVAGTGAVGFGGDGGAATSAAMDDPQGLVFDLEGNLFVTAANDHRVRWVAAGTGIMTTVADDGAAGFGRDGVAATSASLDGPAGVCFDREGNLLIAEKRGHRVRRLAAGTGVVTTIAGTGVAGFGGDGGPATDAQLSGPVFLAVEPAGGLLISEEFNDRVRRVAAGTSVVTTVADSGLTAGLQRRRRRRDKRESVCPPGPRAGSGRGTCSSQT